jgi:hypothetical protein
VLKLWVYEHQRVFSDRFVDEKDCTQLIEMLDEVLELEYNLRVAHLMVPSKSSEESTRRAPSSVLFGNFMEPHSASKCY